MYDELWSEIADAPGEIFDYVETKPMQDQQIENVERYTVMLCSALYESIKMQQLRWHQLALEKGEDAKYHENKIREIEDGGVDHEFYIEEGRKYLKIIHQFGARGSRSVNAFVNKKTGEVYKPATWQAPAKHVRYNLLDEKSREECYQRADWAGGYLYIR